MSENLLPQEAKGASHNPAPQKPIRRKYQAEGQNPEATPPPAVPCATLTKPTQRSVWPCESPKYKRVHCSLVKGRSQRGVRSAAIFNSTTRWFLDLTHRPFKNC